MLSNIVKKTATPDEPDADNIAFLVVRPCFFRGEPLPPGAKFHATLAESFDCLASTRSRLVRPEDAERIVAEYHRQMAAANHAQRHATGWVRGGAYGARA